MRGGDRLPPGQHGGAGTRLGLDAQRATIQAEAHRRGWEHVEWVTDEGVWGGTAPCDLTDWGRCSPPQKLATC